MAAKWDARASPAASWSPTRSRPRTRSPPTRSAAIIDQALADMDALGIHGKDATPYLLGRIVEITDGASLTANIALVRNNARLGAADRAGSTRGSEGTVSPLRR